MDTDNYAPFPEHELTALAARLALAERDWPAARHLYNALECHAALRERCLIAELRLRELLATQHLRQLPFVP